MSNIKTHHYEEGVISLEVPFDEGAYINATEVAKGWNKLPKDWIKTAGTKDYIQAMADRTNILSADLVIVRKGGNDKTAQGTWIHPKLAIAFSRWLDPKFAVWCDQKIEELMSAGKTTASVEERVQWFDKLPGLYKAINTKNKKWSKPFKDIVSTIDSHYDKLDKQKEFVRDCASRFKGDSVKVYNSMIKYYQELFEMGSIDRRTLEDMTNYMFIRIRQRLSTNLTKELKKTAELERKADELVEKYNSLTDPENKPPIPLTGITLSSQDDINRLTKEAMKVDGLQMIFNGFLEVPDNSGQLSVKGKRLPTYTEPKSQVSPFGIACWPSADADSMFVRVSKFMKDIAFKCTIKEGIFYGVLSSSIGVRYYCMINPDTLATIIYKYTITQA